jgi:hypothetical protein
MTIGDPGLRKRAGTVRPRPLGTQPIRPPVGGSGRGGRDGVAKSTASQDNWPARAGGAGGAGGCSKGCNSDFEANIIDEVIDSI